MNLFAALNLVTGQVVHPTREQHRAIEFRKFLDRMKTLFGHLAIQTAIAA